MITKEQFLNGLLNYIEKEVIPSLPSAGKWGVGTISILISSKSNAVFANLSSNPIVKALGLITDDGLININSLSDAMMASAEKYGSMTLQVPFLGKLTFNKMDIERLQNYMEGRI